MGAGASSRKNDSSDPHVKERLKMVNSNPSFNSILRTMINSKEKAENIKNELSSFYSLDSNRDTYRKEAPPPCLPGKACGLSGDDYRCAVLPNDFEYHEMLGSGGFGFVIKVKKKTTGKYYAMKLQTKMCMLHNTKCLDRGMFDELMLHVERSVMAEGCSFPFITSLHYAFTSDTCAALVMDLASCGTLRQYLHHISDQNSDDVSRGLPPGVVKQVIAEAAMALNFLHEHGVMYRDLKPANILLASDGHCLLCDFGLAGRIREKVPTQDYDGYSSEESEAFVNESSAAFVKDSAATSSAVSTESNSSDNSSDCAAKDINPEALDETDMEGKGGKHPKHSCSSTDDDTEKDLANSEWSSPTSHRSTRRIRRKTSCGTVGYRSPEVVRERNLKYSEREGYNEATDMFSLGVTTYVLTCAKKPFENKNNYTPETMDFYNPSSLAEDATTMVPLPLNSTKKPSPAANFEFKTLMSKISYGPVFSQTQIDFCEGLLKRRPQKRLTFSELAKHPWMEGITFDPIALKASPCHPDIMDYIKDKWPTISSDKQDNYSDSDPDSDNDDNNDQTYNVAYEHRPALPSLPWVSSKRMKKKPVAKTPEPRYSSFEDIKSSIIKIVKENAVNKADLEKELRRWNTLLIDKHDRLFDNWNYINKAALEIELDSMLEREGKGW
mmetsp:Transcript_7704/g.15477  ORF Transcript_7704/g.15477 Transcript_7704/m.15477 type:complete len:668 (-) Transcript_7704:8910-10913(-)